MSEFLHDFIKALRSGGLHISPLQTIEATQALTLVGYDNRAVARYALGAVLAKNLEDKNSFYSIFDRFFSINDFADEDPKSSAPTRQARRSEGEKFISALGEGSGDGSGDGGGDGENALHESLIDVWERDDIAALQQRLMAASRASGVGDAQYLTQRAMLIWRVLEAMGMREAERAIEDFSRSPHEAEHRRAERLKRKAEVLRQTVRDFIDQRLSIHAAQSGRRLREDFVAQIRLSAIDRTDMALMRIMIRKMAKKLVSLNGRRRKRARRGQLDVRRTLRANVQYDALLFRRLWKRRRVERPKLMVLLDVSGSVAQAARFLLMFLNSLHDVLPSVRSFAFSNQLGEVTPWFEAKDFETAMTETLARFSGSTDYGRALEKFTHLALKDVDRRTSVLILGDARNNGAPARPDLLQAIQLRAKRVIFLNPEPRSSWDVGDSVMRVYKPFCSSVACCATLKDLERVVSALLRVTV